MGNPTPETMKTIQSDNNSKKILAQKLDFIRANYFRSEFEKVTAQLNGRIAKIESIIDEYENGSLNHSSSLHDESSIEYLHVILGCFSCQILAIETALSRDAMERERNELLIGAQSSLSKFDSILKN